MPEDFVDRERENPGGLHKKASGENEADEDFFLWGQSVYLVTRLLCKSCVFNILSDT